MACGEVSGKLLGARTYSWSRPQLGKSFTGQTFQRARSSAPRATGFPAQPKVVPSPASLTFPRLASSPRSPPSHILTFIGLTRRHTRAHLIRAVMEGVVFGMRQGLDLLVTQGVPVTRVVASGGAAQHSLWVHLQADIYNRPIWRTRTVEAAATGAAMLAGIGTGVFSSVEDAVARVVRWDPEVVEPSPWRASLYEAHFGVFSRLYEALAPLMHALTDVE